MKSINWKDHIINLFVVILGISIAFYLENYKEDRKSLDLSKKYLNSLEKDLEADLEMIDTLIQVNDWMLDGLTKLSGGALGRPINNDSLRNYLSAITYNPPFNAQATSYESMKASGQIDLIPDFDTRNKVIELYEQYYRGTAQFDDALSEHLRDFLKPFFIYKIQYVGPSSVDPGFLKEPEFRNMIFGYQYLFSTKAVFYQEVRTEIDSTLQMIRRFK